MVRSRMWRRWRVPVMRLKESHLRVKFHLFCTISCRNIPHTWGDRYPISSASHTDLLWFKDRADGVLFTRLPVCSDLYGTGPVWSDSRTTELPKGTDLPINQQWSMTDGGASLRTQTDSGLQRETEVRERLRDGPDPEPVNRADGFLLVIDQWVSDQFEHEDDHVFCLWVNCDVRTRT